MADTPTDSMAPWTIKSVATVTREAVIAAARRDGLTVGQWLEKRVAEWEGAGSPTRVEIPTASLGDLAAAMEAARSLADAAGVPVPPAMAREAAATVRYAMRRARGLPAPARLSPASRLALPHPAG